MTTFRDTSLPWITIITVVKNGADVLAPTIDSVSGQEYRHLDYFIVDGGSTDGTLDVIRRYAGNITWWESCRDNGIYDGMNKGWRRAREDSYILFLGAGDRIISLPRQMERYRRGEVVYGTVRIGDDRIFRPRSDYQLKLYNSLHHQALLVDKRLHPEPPFDLSFARYADFDLNQRLARGGARFVFDDTFQSFALPGGTTQELDVKETLAVVRKNYGFGYAGVTLVAWAAARWLPWLRRFRPFIDKSD